MKPSFGSASERFWVALGRSRLQVYRMWWHAGRGAGAAATEQCACIQGICMHADSALRSRAL